MLTNYWYRSLLLISVVLTSFALCSSAGASVAYIDANEVWVSSDDGSKKVRLSAGEGDWREVAQSDQGHILATRKESGKVSQFTFFTIWDPSGKLIHFGSLSGDVGTNVYPLSIDITPSGGNIVYGYLRASYGIYLKVSSDASTGVPLAITTGKYPTLVGDRIIAQLADHLAGVQVPGNLGSDDFVPWIQYPIDDPANPLYDLALTRTDVSSNGTVAASEFRDDTFYTQKINLSKWSGLNGTYVDDCILPTAGPPSDISVSQDGTTITWRDSRGVVIAGAPNFSGPAECVLTRPPSVISATGVYPSYGPFNVVVATPPGSQPTLTVGASIKLAKLKSGVKISVLSPIAGKAKLTLTIKGSKVGVKGKKGKKLIKLATGSGNVAANVAKTIKLKFTSAGKKLKKKLKGKKATLTLSIGGQTAVKTVKLK